MEKGKSKELDAKDFSGACRIQGDNDDKSWSASSKATLVEHSCRNRKGKKPETQTSPEP